MSRQKGVWAQLVVLPASVEVELLGVDVVQEGFDRRPVLVGQGWGHRPEEEGRGPA